MNINHEYMQPLVDLSLIQPLLNKAMEYQNLGYGTVFINIMGQVNIIEIDLHHHGWVSSKGCDESLRINISKEKFQQKDIDNIINEIQEEMDNMETLEQRDNRLDAEKLKLEKEQYEKLKLKFG